MRGGHYLNFYPSLPCADAYRGQSKALAPTMQLCIRKRILEHASRSKLNFKMKRNILFSSLECWLGDHHDGRQERECCASTAENGRAVGREVTMTCYVLSDELCQAEQWHVCCLLGQVTHGRGSSKATHLSQRIHLRWRGVCTFEVQDHHEACHHRHGRHHAGHVR